MLVFGHLGITLAGAALVSRAKGAYGARRVAGGGSKKNTAGDGRASATRRSPAGAAGSIKAIDYRLVAVGALLPDLIDKPIGVLFFGSDGRTLAHTLLFGLLLAAIGIYLYYFKGRQVLLIVSLCSMSHLALDRMWLDMEGLLWPIYGFVLPHFDLADYTAFKDWISSMFDDLTATTASIVFVSEAVGAGVVAAFLLRFYLERRQSSRK
ncbi:metal-dependent hydrolase [Chloroflexota bacterium]